MLETLVKRLKTHQVYIVQAANTGADECIVMRLCNELVERILIKKAELEAQRLAVMGAAANKAIIQIDYLQTIEVLWRQHKVRGPQVQVVDPLPVKRGNQVQAGLNKTLDLGWMLADP